MFLFNFHVYASDYQSALLHTTLFALYGSDVVLTFTVFFKAHHFYILAKMLWLGTFKSNSLFGDGKEGLYAVAVD